MTETSLQTVLGLGSATAQTRFVVELGVALFAALAALALRRRRRALSPTGFLLIAIGLVSDVLMHLSSPKSDIRVPLETLGLVLFFFGIIRLLLDALDAAFSRKVRSSNIFWDLMMLLLYAVVLMFVLHATTKVDFSSLLATSAVLSVIIGFGLQETLGNIFSGLTMQLQKPFEPGDWVRFGAHLGRVHGIGWRATRLLTRSNERVEIPNNLLAKDVVINYTRGLVADDLYIGLSYDEPPNRVKEVLLGVLRTAPGVLSQPEPEVHAWEYGDSAIKYRLRFWLAEYGPDEQVRDAVVSNIWYALRRQSIDIPFPIRTVYLHPMRPEQELLAEKEHHLLGELRLVDFLSDLSDEELRTMLPNVRVHQFGNGEILMHEGEVGACFHILRRGAVEVLARGQNGGSIHIADLKAPAFFGEIALLTGEPRTASIVARSDVEVLEIGRETFVRLFREHPDALEEVSRVVGTRLNETRQRRQAVASAGAIGGDSNWLIAQMRRIFDL